MHHTYCWPEVLPQALPVLRACTKQAAGLAWPTCPSWLMLLAWHALNPTPAGWLAGPCRSRMYMSTSDDDLASLDGASDSGGSTGAQVVPQRSVLDMLLLAEWEDRAEQGLFRYDVTACPTKMVAGSYGFVAQCNEGRASKKRPTEFRVDLVSQPFDGAKFNFTKALQKEVLLQFEPGAAGRSKPSFTPAAPTSPSPNLVLINVSPIEYGHVLLVPKALDQLQQLVTPATLLLALQFAREANNPYFRLGFNSLGAYGTINHLHFQGYYLAAPFAIERALSRPLPLSSPPNGRKRGVQVHELVDYPVRSLVFEAGDSLNEVSRPSNPQVAPCLGSPGLLLWRNPAAWACPEQYVT